MKKRNPAATVIAALVFCLTLQFSRPSNAELTFKMVGEKSPDVAVQGTIKLSGEDVPALQECVATIKGNIVEVSVPTREGGDRNVTLRGAIIKSELSAGTFKGYIAINDDPYLATIDDPDVEELIEVTGGGVVRGKITEISTNGVKIGDQTIPLSVIARICSPTIFEFSCAIASEMKNVAAGFEGRSQELRLQRTTSIADEKKGSQKRCCKFPPLTVPGKGKGKGGGHHIHIIIPI
jgi:hypothetical protein